MDAAARFAPSDSWRRPSDYVAYMVQRFEDEWTNPRSGKKESRPLKRDQVYFVAQFAQSCNTVWDEDRKVEEGELDVKNITCFNILLMGQGGSGKTAVVQEIVLRTLDFLFGCEATLIVCSKWSQAENISRTRTRPSLATEPLQSVYSHTAMPTYSLATTSRHSYVDGTRFAAWFWRK